MIETIQFRDKLYPKFQAEGFAAKFIFPFADQVCHGYGYDIGCNRPEWKLPDDVDRKVFPIDMNDESNDYHAHYLPKGDVDFIFSSHCLEHILEWVDALDYWTNKLASGGVLFLYLPHPDQDYWLPFHNRKHKNYIPPNLIYRYLLDSGKYKNIFVSERDLNHSFAAMAEKI